MTRDQEDDHEKLLQLRRDLMDFIQKVESAFPIDERGNPDYSAHRSTHKDQTSRDKELKEARLAIIKNILTWAFIGALTVIGSTLAQAYLVPVLKFS